MSTASLPLQALCDIARQAALDAGTFIQSVDRSTLQQNFKQAGTSAASQVVTSVDIRSEAIIRDALEPLSLQWEITFVGEESSPNEKLQAGEKEAKPDRLLKPYFWCVDPLDGTLPFVEGRTGYAVSIALLAQSGEPLIGVVYDPVDKTLIHAIKGQGVLVNGAARKQQAVNATMLTVLADHSFDQHPRYSQALDCLNACAQSLGLDGACIEYGSGAVKNACHVLDNQAACYVKLPKAEEGGGSIWDFAASALIVSEAGGWVSNSNGKPLALNQPGSTFMNAQGVIYASNERIASYLISALRE